jgi:hypothetical protein
MSLPSLCSAQDTPPTITPIPAKCGITALETKEFQLITNELELQVSLNLTGWEEFFLRLTAIVQHWNSLKDNTKMSKYVKRLVPLQIATMKIWSAIADMQSLVVPLVDKPKTSTIHLHLVHVPFSSRLDHYTPMLDNMEAVLTDTSYSVPADEITTASQIAIQSKPFLREKTFLSAITPDLIHEFEVYSPSKCPQDIPNTYDILFQIIKNRFSLTTPTFKVPCLDIRNSIQEFVVLDFPYRIKTNWHQSISPITYIWYFNATKTFVTGTDNDLQPYDPTLDYPIFTAAALPNSPLSAAHKAVLQNPFVVQAFQCPPNTLLNQPTSQLVTVGRNRIVYFSPISLPNDKEPIHVNCKSGKSDLTLSPGISLITIDHSCRLNHPRKIKHKFVKPLEENTQIYYTLHEPFDFPPHHSAHPNTNSDAIILNLPKYATYAIGAVGVVAVLACARCNLSALCSIGRRFFRFYRYFQRVLHHPDIPPPPAPIIALVDASGPRLRPLLT